jgi:hemolysin-activating ACP:hemolysin acyltransferase
MIVKFLSLLPLKSLPNCSLYLRRFDDFSMKYSFKEVYQHADPTLVSHYGQLGYAMHLLAHSPNGASRQILYLNLILLPAMLTHQICFLFDEDGNPVAYLIWAFLSPDVERRVLTSFRFELHESEWNEGSSLWIVDLVAPHGHLKNVLRFARDKLFHDEETVRYIRTKKHFRLAIEHSRESLFGCLRSMPPVSPYCRCQRLDCQLYDSVK